MDFSKAIQIATGTATSAFVNLNSITAAPTVGTPFSGYLVENVSYANGSIGGFTESQAQRDGSEADIALLGPRSVQMVVQVYGSSLADFYDKLNDLNGSMRPYPSYATSDDGFRDLRFVQPTAITTSNNTTGLLNLVLRVRPTALPSYQLNNDMVTPQTSDRGVSTRASVTLFAKDPRKLSQATRSATLSVSASTSTTTTVTNDGNYNVYPTVTFVSTSASTQTATISTSLFTTSVVIPANTTVTINGPERTVNVGSTLRMDLVLAVTTILPYLITGSTTVTINALSSIAVSFAYQEAWL
jgi:hypothetical protein